MKLSITQTLNILLSIKGVQKKDVGDQLGTSHVNITNIMKRDRIYSDNITKIAGVCGCDVKITYIDHNTGETVFESLIK